jgi:hypothetical protein
MQAKFSKQDWAALALLLLVILISFYRYLLPPFPMILPNSTLGTDLDREIWTLSHYLRETFNQTGEIALWRPYFMSGIPLFGNPLNPATDPFHWILGVQAIPLPLALTLDMLIHFFVGAAGMYLVLRLLCGLRVTSAWVGAVIWGLAPRLIIHMTGGHWWLISSVIWIPWVYFFFHASWITRRPIYAVFLGVVMALAAMNNLQYAVYNGLMLIVFALAYLFRERATFVKSLLRAIMIGTIALVIMLGLFAATLLPQFEYMPFTNRVQLTYEEAVASSLPLPLLLGIFVPSKLRFPEAFLYLSTGAVILLIAGIGSGWAKRERTWAFGTLIALLLSLGSTGVIYAALYYGVPAMSLFRTPERFYIYVLFGVAALGAFAFDQWLSQVPPKRLTRPIVLGIGLLYLLLIVVEISTPNLLPFYVFPHGLFASVIGVLVMLRPQKWIVIGVVVLITAELIYTSVTLSAPVTEEELIAADDPAIVFLRENISPDERVLIPYGGISDMALLANGINTADGYNGAQIKTYADYLNAAIGCDYEGYSVAAPAVRASADAVRACPEIELDVEALQRLNVRYVILPRPLHEREPVFADNERYIYDMGEGMGRAWGVENWRDAQCDGAPNVIDIAMRHGVPYTSTLPTETSQLPTILDSERTVNREWFLVDSPDEVLLIRSEAYLPGMRVTIDGRDALSEGLNVARVYCALQGVWLRPGEHLVEFEYFPVTLKFGIPLSVITAIFVIGLIGLYPLRRALRLLKGKN